MPPTDNYEARISAPSRLHFGLLSFGGGEGRRYGGLGAMIDRPGLQLRVRAANQFSVSGPLAERAAAFARRVAAACGFQGDPPCRIEIESAPPEHVGLGTGTQLGLAVAAGVQPLLSSAPTSAEQLAGMVGRGARSAIGTHGFAAGGLLFEQGKYAEEALSPLTERMPLPEAWRFVLWWPEDCHGLSGDAEREVFRRLPEVAPETTRLLTAIAKQEVLPAAETGDVNAFAHAVYRYGHAAGMCFAGCQPGAFASPQVAALVDAIRALGVTGAGQSSWGPTVFAVVSDEGRAGELVAELKADRQFATLSSLIAAPNNCGAQIKTNA